MRSMAASTLELLLLEVENKWPTGVPGAALPIAAELPIKLVRLELGAAGA